MVINYYLYFNHLIIRLIIRSDDKRVVKYWETSRFIHDSEQTSGSLEDKINLVNIPVLMAFSIIDNVLRRFPLTTIISPLVNNVINAVLITFRENFIERRTAREVIEGRRINMLDTLDIVAKPLRMLGLPIPEYGISIYKLRNNTYGFLAIRNDSKFGPFEVYTGMKGSEEKFMKFKSFLNKRFILKIILYLILQNALYLLFFYVIYNALRYIY